MALLTSAAQYSGAGAPTSVAGQVGDQYHDTTSSGSLYICVTAGSPGTWQQVSGASGAPTNATYLLQTANGSLTNAQAMGALGTGIVKNTTTTGIQSIAVSPADYYAPSYQYFYASASPLNMYMSVGGAVTPPVTGANNIFVGSIPPSFSSGNNNLIIGFNDNALITGSGNTIVGIGTGNDIAGNNNTCVGFSAGSGFDGSDGTYIGTNAAPTVGGLVNAGAIGYNSTISVSNAINIGDGTAVGFNNPSPAYSLDIEPLSGGGVAAIALAVSTLPATSGSKGTIWRNSSDQLNYTNSAGVTTIISNPGSIPSFTGVAFNTAGTLTAATASQVTTAALLNPALQNTFIASGDIHLNNTSGQTLLIGNGSTGTNLYMPDPTSTNPWSLGYPYLVMMAKTAPSFIFEQMNVRNFGGAQINDIFGNPITMTPCDNWVFWFNGTVGVGYLLSNNATETQSYDAAGQWFSTTGATIPTTTGVFSSTVIYGRSGMLYVNYIIPGFSASLLSPSSFVFQTTSQVNFPTYAFPGNTSQTLLLLNGNNTGTGLVTVNSTATGQVLVNGNSLGADFSIGAMCFGPISITAPISLPF